MSKDFTGYNDAASRAVFRAFEERLAPLIEDIAPGFSMQNMVIRRDTDPVDYEDRVQIRLIIKRGERVNMGTEPGPQPLKAMEQLK